MRRRPAGAAFLLAIALLGAGCSRAASNKQIATHIQARMASDPQLRGTSLIVAVKDGVATVSGQVPTVAARYEAFKVASESTGVKKVNDEMTIAEPGANTQAASTAPPPATQPKSEKPIAGNTRSARRSTRASEQSASSQVAAQAASPEAEPEPSSIAPEPAPAMNEAPVRPAPPPPEVITIPQGTAVPVRMIDSVNSVVNHTGDILHASLTKPILVGKQLVAPKGADVYLRLVEVRSAGHLAGRSELRIELYRIVIQGTSYPLISNDYIDKAASRTKRSVLAIIGGSAIGAAIGAIAGGGKGAAIGAAAGGGGGAVYQGATKSKQVNIAPETLLKFKLAQPASVAVNPNIPSPSPIFRP
ncbi:MAG TPA: BON domain-containing protein [Patescibacteria group bacterium]|nr:BON domain-containing protein [Patescibacteria group bacterium]